MSPRVSLVAVGLVALTLLVSGAGGPRPCEVTAQPAPTPAPQPPAPPAPPAPQVLTLTVPPSFRVPVGQPVEVVPTTNARRVTYRPQDTVQEDGSVDRLIVFPSGRLNDPKVMVGWQVRAGTYRVEVFGSLNDDHAFAETSVEVYDPRPVPPGPKPKPKPDPPTPDPDPDADKGKKWAASKLWVVVVEESQQMAIKRGAMLTDPALLARMTEKGHEFRIADQNAVGPDGKPPKDIARHLERAKGKPLPQVFLVDAQGVDRAQFDYKDPADLLKKLAQYGG